MKYRIEDANRDMTWGSGDKNFYTNQPEAVAQAVLTRLLLWSGEWFLDITEGTQYQNGVMGKNTKKSADTVIRARILETDGVVNIVAGTYSSTFDGEKRQFSVSCTINTIYGVTVIQGTL